MADKVKCDHVLGIAFELNGEEGPAWIRSYQRESNYVKDHTDWIRYFPHCPVCGERNIEVHEDIARLESV